MRRVYLSVILSCSVAISACVSGLNPVQEQEYRAYKAKGLLVEEKNPALAAGLGIVPVLSLGYYYNGEVVYGILNTINPLWFITSPLDGYKASKNINFYATKVTVSKLQKQEIRGLDQLAEAGTITREQYFKQKKEVEDKYSPDEF
jgi:hypothetical protein